MKLGFSVGIVLLKSLFAIRRSGDEIIGAIFSDHVASEDIVFYRYGIWRKWNNDNPMVLVIGCNPSKANEGEDDPTIQKLTRLVQNKGFGGFYMGHLYGYITPHPNVMKERANKLGFDSIIGPENDEVLEEMSAHVNDVLFTYGDSCVYWWGRNLRRARQRANHVRNLMNRHDKWTLGLTRNGLGAPRHPLQSPVLPDNIPWQPFEKYWYKKTRFV